MKPDTPTAPHECDACGQLTLFPLGKGQRVGLCSSCWEAKQRIRRALEAHRPKGKR